MARQQSWTLANQKQVKEIWDKSSKRRIKTTINGINALPTFTFDEEDAAGCKTFTTQDMLSQGFLATTLFYPMAHNEVSKYMNQCARNIYEAEKILSSGEDIGTHIIGPRCQPTFEG